MYACDLSFVWISLFVIHARNSNNLQFTGANLQKAFIYPYWLENREVLIHIDEVVLSIGLSLMNQLVSLWFIWTLDHNQNTTLLNVSVLWMYNSTVFSTMHLRMCCHGTMKSLAFKKWSLWCIKKEILLWCLNSITSLSANMEAEVCGREEYGNQHETSWKVLENRPVTNFPKVMSVRLYICPHVYFCLRPIVYLYQDLGHGKSNWMCAMVITSGEQNFKK